MKSFEIKDIRGFMAHLLTHDTFDEFTVSEADVTTFASFSIDGTINRDFFTKEEQESDSFPKRKYVKYASLRKYLYELIKGRRTPTSVRIIFLAPESVIDGILEQTDTTFVKNDINSLAVTVSYRNGTVSALTGTNLKVFSPDRSVENAWDDYFGHFLSENHIDF